MVRMAGGIRTDRGLRRLIVALVALVLALLAVKVTAFAGASFSAGSQNPANTFTAGTLVVSNDKDGAYVVDTTGLRPGLSAWGDLTLQSNGDLPAVITLEGSAPVVSPAGSTIAAALRLTIEDVTSGSPASPAIYDGAFGDLGSVVASPALAAGAQRVLRFTVTFPTAAADPVLQGATAEQSIRITAVAQ